MYKEKKSDETPFMYWTGMQSSTNKFVQLSPLAQWIGTDDAFLPVCKLAFI
jgi:hypothetical protein